MKAFCVSLIAAVFAMLSQVNATAQVAGQHGVFKVSVTLPVQRVILGKNGAPDKIVTKTLMAADIINLTRGRPLGTKIDTAHEVLAMDVTFEDSTGAVTPVSTLVVYDPTIGGKGGIQDVVADLTEVKFTTAYSDAATKGFGVGKGTFRATTKGTPAQHAIVSGVVTGNATSVGPHIFDKQDKTAPAGSCAFEGPFHFRITTMADGTVEWDGFILKGAARVSGKPIGNYVQM